MNLPARCESTGAAFPAARRRGTPLTGSSNALRRWTMPDLDFALTGAEAVADAAAPTLAFQLRITNRSSEPIHNVWLRCQLRIESPKRRYAEDESARLVD